MRNPRSEALMSGLTGAGREGFINIKVYAAYHTHHLFCRDV
jgi:hypothetical protein